jgi:hypothetical protein
VSIVKKLTFFGILLIAIGALSFLLSTVQFKRNEEVLRVGNFSATATTSRTVPAFRYVGIGCASAGFILVIVGLVRRR